MGVVNFAGGSVETCIDHEVSSRTSRRLTVSNPMGVTGRALDWIETAAKAGRIQTPKFCPHAQLRSIVVGGSAPPGVCRLEPDSNDS